MLGTYGTLLPKAVTLNRNKKYADQAPLLFPSKNNNNLVRDFVPKKIKFFCDAKNSYIPAYIVMFRHFAPCHKFDYVYCCLQIKSRHKWRLLIIRYNVWSP